MPPDHAWRMSSPHIPGKGWEDVAAKITHEDGTVEYVASYQKSNADALIERANSEETWRRRTVDGHPQEHWYVVIDGMWRHKLDEEALPILEKLMAAAESLTQYDTREPQDYWFERAAKVHRRRKDYAAEVAVLERWLAHWPPERWRPNSYRERMLHRLARARDLCEGDHGQRD